jgi:pre-rRNA-processing protein TSR4
MPNLINVLSSRAATAEHPPSMVQDRENVVEESEKAKAGMEWGTCMIFSCEKDCCEGDECWREEFVLIQWDD